MSNCINYKHPDVAKIAGELNVSPVVAAAKIGVWQSKNNIEDRFPTVEELQSANEKIFTNISESLENKIQSLSNRDDVKIFIDNIILNNPRLTKEEYGEINTIRPYPNEKGAKYISQNAFNKLPVRVFAQLADSYKFSKDSSNDENKNRHLQNYNNLLEILKEVFPNLSEYDIKKASNMAWVMEDAEFDAMEDEYLEKESNNFRFDSENILSWTERIKEYDLQSYLNKAPFKDVLDDKKTIKKDLSEFESESEESIFSENIIKKGLLKGVLFIEDKIDKLKKDYSSEHSKILFDNKQGKITVDEILENILNNFNNLTPEGKELIQKARRLVGRTGAKFQFVSDEQLSNKNTLMQIVNNTNTIQISRNRIKNITPKEVIEGFLHELAHAQTIQALTNPQTFEEKEFNEFIERAYYVFSHNDLQKQIDQNIETYGEERFYGFKNKFEFVSEIYANPKFRAELKKLDEQKRYKFWDNFIDAVRRLFGLVKSKRSNDLIEKVIDFVESDRRDYQGISNQKQLIFEKQIESSETYELETIDKKAEHLVNKAKSKVAELINRTKKSNKEKAGEFLEEFRVLEHELERLSGLNKFKAITAYMISFKNAIYKLEKGLESKFKIIDVVYNGEKHIKVKNFDGFKNEKGEFIIPEDVKDTVDKTFFENNKFIVDSELYNNIENESIAQLSNKDYLDVANNYEDYLASYDLLDDIKSLIDDTLKDSTLSREDKLEIRIIKTKISELSKPHDNLVAKIKKLKKESAIKLFSDASTNKKVINKWKNKLSLEYDKLTNPKKSKLEWIGNQMSTTYSEQIKKDLEKAAKSIIDNPYIDITSFAKTWSDLLNINSPLINMMANVVGKMRDSILKDITVINFKYDKIFKSYSDFNNSVSMSKKYGNLLELNESEDRYYLKGKYSIKFKENYNKMLNSLNEKNKDNKDFNVKEDPEYKKWIKENTVFDELGNRKPSNKYLNKPLTTEEEKVLDFFRTQTKSNHELNYKGKGGLYSTFFGAEYYKLPSKTKSVKERTLEGDFKGQVKDAWTDLKETKVDDINYGQAFDNRGEELKRVQINFRGKLESKDQSLDLFTVYRAEEANSISFKHRSANENKLKLFLDIAKEKQYKKKSLISGKWAKNIFSKEEVQGQTFSGEHSNEAEKIKGILETALYDVTSYNEEKFLGSLDANKVTSRINGAAAFVGMTLNIGSGFVNFLNGQTMMTMLKIGGKYINKFNLAKAEWNYTTNMHNILADISNPVKKSFHNQMLNMFDIIGGMNINKQDFLNNSTVKEMMSLHNANFINESVEHGLNCILTEAILRSIPVMNKEHKYIDKEGNVTIKENAASIFDMLYLDDNGILKTKDYFTYSEYNLVDNYHTSGKQSINYLLKKKVEDLYGVYDNNMKAEISKKWYGKMALMFKNFFLSQAQYRYKGIGTANKSKDELDDEDLTFNNAEQEFTEGIYTTVVRTFFPLIRHLNLQMTKENFKNLSDYEKANLKQVFFEVSLTVIILPLLGAIMAANAGDDDDELYFLLFAFRRLESELSQFRNIAELNRMISNPVAANRFLQNGFTVINDIMTPINFNPKENESYFDWLSENSKDENILLNHAFKLAPGKSLFMNTYKQRYSLIDK